MDKLKKWFPVSKRDPNLHEKFMMRLAFEEAKQGTRVGDGPPFGAAIANRDKQIVCRGRNLVLKNTDPTAHAEFVAIRKALTMLGTSTLEGCVLYSSAEPCAMCVLLCAMVKIEKVYYGASMQDANDAGYKKKAEDFFKHLKKKDYFKKVYCKQISVDEAANSLRQLSISEKANCDNSTSVNDRIHVH